MLPICAPCKNIRDDHDYWGQVEEYLQKHTDAMFTLGICPKCARKLYPDFPMADFPSPPHRIRFTGPCPGEG